MTRFGGMAASLTEFFTCWIRLCDAGCANTKLGTINRNISPAVAPLFINTFHLVRLHVGSIARWQRLVCFRIDVFLVLLRNSRCRAWRPLHVRAMRSWPRRLVSAKQKNPRQVRSSWSQLLQISSAQPPLTAKATEHCHHGQSNLCLARIIFCRVIGFCDPGSRSRDRSPCSRTLANLERPKPPTSSGPVRYAA
jgi:hypothetical protein